MKIFNLFRKKDNLQPTPEFKNGEIVYYGFDAISSFVHEDMENIKYEGVIIECSFNYFLGFLYKIKTEGSIRFIEEKYLKRPKV